MIAASEKLWTATARLPFISSFNCFVNLTAGHLLEEEKKMYTFIGKFRAVHARAHKISKLPFFPFTQKGNERVCARTSNQTERERGGEKNGAKKRSKWTHSKENSIIINFLSVNARLCLCWWWPCALGPWASVRAPAKKPTNLSVIY